MFHMIPCISSIFSSQKTFSGKHSWYRRRALFWEKNQRFQQNFHLLRFLKDSVLQFPLFNINSFFVWKKIYFKNYCLFAKPCCLSCVRLCSGISPRLVTNLWLLWVKTSQSSMYVLWKIVCLRQRLWQHNGQVTDQVMDWNFIVYRFHLNVWIRPVLSY